MRTFSGISFGVIVAVGAGFFSAPLWQSDESRATQAVPGHATPEAAPRVSATQAYRDGQSTLKVGKVDDALPKLRYAAARGVLGAQITLARHYAASDRAETFRYFSLIADQHADIAPSSPIARYVAEAFVALGDLQKDGVAGVVPADRRRAAGLYFHAASYFGFPAAQYRLARMHMSGDGTARDINVAVKWLANAAKKRHAPSQALLGDILWRGELVSAQPARALALMISANESRTAVAAHEAAAIRLGHDRALSLATPDIKREARAIAAVWRAQTYLDLKIDAADAGLIDSASVRPIAKDGVSIKDANAATVSETAVLAR